MDAAEVEWREPIWDMNLPDLYDEDTGELLMDRSEQCSVTVELNTPNHTYGTTLILAKWLASYPAVTDKLLELARDRTLREAGLGD